MKFQLKKPRKQPNEIIFYSVSNRQAKAFKYPKRKILCTRKENFFALEEVFVFAVCLVEVCLFPKQRTNHKCNIYSSGIFILRQRL